MEVGRRAALMGLAGFCATAFTRPDAAAAMECAQLGGTFIQPTNAQAAWSASDWQGTHLRTPGNAWRRASGIGSPHSSQASRLSPCASRLRARLTALSTVASI